MSKFSTLVAQTRNSKRWRSPSTSRAGLRHAALNLLAATQQLSGRHKSGMIRPRVAFLYLHSVPPQQVGAFRDIMAALAKHHRFVSYSDAVALVQAGPIDEPVVTVSFDDGFASNIGASRVLEEFGVSGCFFVPTGFVGVDSVSDARRFFGTADGVDEPAMSWKDLEMLVARGHEVGNHTVTHRVLSELPTDEMAEEIYNARAVLAERLGEGKHFAWPRGRFHHATREVVRTAFESGHVSCASAVRGAHVRVSPTDMPCLRRDHLMTAWPRRHNLYFVGAAPDSDGSWPDDWGHQ